MPIWSNDTWLWVKVMVESGERDEKTIAAAAEVANPKRIYFLQQEIRNISVAQLLKTLPILLELETSLKRGQDPSLPYKLALLNFVKFVVVEMSRRRS